MTLQILNYGHVASDEGFHVQLNQERIVYQETESQRYMEILIEHLGDPYELAVYAWASSDWQQNGQIVQAASGEDIKEVVFKIERCLRLLNVNFSVKWSRQA